jgi:5'-nucleotidase (lipoprotein e(P4) family)
MSRDGDSRGWLLGGIGLAVGLLIGYLAGQDGQPRPNPQERSLDADLWVQTAAEYRACCLQTYRLAGEQLEKKLAEPPKGTLPPAVVMDLDETVLDNSPFQTWMYRYRVEYAQPLWDRWEEDFPDEVRLVPGAGDFIARAKKAGVAVVYISNRSQKYRPSTVRALVHLGLEEGDVGGRLLLATTTGDKTARRKAAEKQYRVLMYFGDNLRDFSEEFRAPRVAADDVAGLKKAIADRYQKVERHRERWGHDWVILPNPCYGEWTKLVGRRPAEVLRQATMPGP